jgi:HSP20 family protein
MISIRYPGFSSFTSAFQELDRMRREMDRLFADVMGRSALASGSGVFPALNVREDADNIYVQAELPGVKPEEVEISVVGSTLSLRGERRLENIPGVSYHRRERKAGQFQKALTLSSNIKADDVKAEYKNGVLYLILPKSEHAKPKKIPVKTQ